jgi:hypothetical protein
MQPLVESIIRRKLEHLAGETLAVEFRTLMGGREIRAQLHDGFHAAVSYSDVWLTLDEFSSRYLAPLVDSMKGARAARALALD